VSEERLGRLERILETAIALSQRNREDIERLTRETRTISANLDRTNDRVNQFIVQAERDREFYRTQAESDRQFFRNELTGIRTEVSRIVEYLFGQRGEG
jgi:ABC-type transporter Mla subunit MlaD